MATTITYNQFIDVLKGFAQSHLQIHDFGHGDFHELTSREENGLDPTKPKTYPLMWVFPLPSALDGKIDNVRVHIAFMDLVNNGETNELEVESDMRELIKDLKGHLKDNPSFPHQTIEDRVPTDPFTERFDDVVTGWGCEITLRQPFAYNRCAIPFDPEPSGITESHVSILDDLGNVITTVPCGGSYTETTVTPSGIAYQRPLITGQSTIYEVGDDGWHFQNGTYDYTPPIFPVSFARLDFGAAVPFKTLKENNAFGNLNRFTDDAGGQDYTNDLVIDHLTGLMWYRVELTADNWTTLILSANSSTQGSFSDWRMSNMNELDSILRMDLSQSFNYAPFNYTRPATWVNTTSPDTASQAYRFEDVGHRFINIGKTASANALICRNQYT